MAVEAATARAREGGEEGVAVEAATARIMGPLFRARDQTASTSIASWFRTLTVAARIMGPSCRRGSDAVLI